MVRCEVQVYTDPWPLWPQHDPAPLGVTTLTPVSDKCKSGKKKIMCKAFSNDVKLIRRLLVLLVEAILKPLLWKEGEEDAAEVSGWKPWTRWITVSVCL